MKKIVTLIAFLSIGAVHLASAQKFTGMATYKTDTKMEIQMDSSQMADHMDDLQKQLRMAMQKEYQLTFTKSESNWKEQEKLNNPNNGGAVQIRIMGMGGGADGLLYKNTKDKKTIESTDDFGKLFLISGDLEPYEWEMTAETKQIGKYTCYKAITKQEVTEMHLSDINGDTSEEEKKVTRTITAWYAPEIPVSHGPENYWGLPGLILEVSDGSRIMICTQVILNPEKEAIVKIPTKGKKVTSEEYGRIMNEHLEKMNKMYGGGKKKGNHDSFSITIEH